MLGDDGMHKIVKLGQEDDSARKGALLQSLMTRVWSPSTTHWKENTNSYRLFSDFTLKYVDPTPAHKKALSNIYTCLV